MSGKDPQDFWNFQVHGGHLNRPSQDKRSCFQWLCPRLHKFLVEACLRGSDRRQDQKAELLDLQFLSAHESYPCFFLDHREKLDVTAGECHWLALLTEWHLKSSERSAKAGRAEH